MFIWKKVCSQENQPRNVKIKYQNKIPKRREKEGRKKVLDALRGGIFPLKQILKEH